MRYHFATNNGEYIGDDEGADLPGIDAAKAAALRHLLDSLRGDGAKLWHTGDFSVICTDDTGLTIFSLTLVVTMSPAGAQPPSSG